MLRLPRASVECLLAAPVAQGVAPVGGVAASAVGEALVTASSGNALFSARYQGQPAASWHQGKPSASQWAR